MHQRAKFFIASPIVLFCISLALFAAPERSPLDKTLDAYFGIQAFREVAISPDGHRVAWVESLHGPNGASSTKSAIYMADLTSLTAPPHRITAGDGKRGYAEHDIAWSPDSRQLAFLSDQGHEGQLELYVGGVVGGPAHKLTNLTGALAGPSWSPDGKTLALLFAENAPRTPGPGRPMAPPSGVIEPSAYEQRLTIVQVASRSVQQISPPDLYVYEYDWSPDGKAFLATAAHGAGDANWYIAELYTINAGSGETKSIYKPPVDMQIAVPRWSPNGKTLAFIAGLMSDEGATGGDIFTMPVTGSEPRNLTPDLKASPSWLAWLSPSQILFAEQIDGESNLATLDPAEGKVTTLWKSSETTSTGGWSYGVSLARDGKTCAVVLQSFQRPPEVWAGPIGTWKQVTHANRSTQPMCGKAERLHWSSDGRNIQGWLLYPRDYDSSRQYPLVVSVHGGPSWMWMPIWPGAFYFFDLALLSHEGYFVLLPNPRGSFGQGEAFTRANVKDFGYGDFRDILAGVDEVVKTLPVDNSRLGIGGWSYGGFMTMWAVTQTNRFHAAVAGAGIANYLSYYGQNKIDLWMVPFFGASVYDDPAVYARSSPINFIKNVKTPTLMVVGDGDEECPVPQSLEFWHALRDQRTETQLVVYPNEGHGISDPEHRRDILGRTIAWYNQHLR